MDLNKLIKVLKKSGFNFKGHLINLKQSYNSN